MDTVLRLLEVALGYPEDPSQDVIDILTSCINTAKEEILLQGADLDTTKESDINFLFNYISLPCFIYHSLSEVK